MRREGFFVPRGHAPSAARRGRSEYAASSSTLADAKPQHPRRAALGKTSKALERQVERRLRGIGCASAAAHALFEGGIGAAEEMQRQVHPIRTHPRGLGGCCDLLRANAAEMPPDLRARRLVDVDRDE